MEKCQVAEWLREWIQDQKVALAGFKPDSGKHPFSLMLSMVPEWLAQYLFQKTSSGKCPSPCLSPWSLSG